MANSVVIVGYIDATGETHLNVTDTDGVRKIVLSSSARGLLKTWFPDNCPVVNIDKYYKMPLSWFPVKVTVTDCTGNEASTQDLDASGNEVQ